MIQIFIYIKPFCVPSPLFYSGFPLICHPPIYYVQLPSSCGTMNEEVDKTKALGTEQLVWDWLVVEDSWGENAYKLPTHPPTHPAIL